MLVVTRRRYDAEFTDTGFDQSIGNRKYSSLHFLFENPLLSSPRSCWLIPPHLTSPSLLLRFVALIIKRLVSNERALVINLLTDQPPANFEDTLLQVIRPPCCAILVRYSSFGICLWLCVLRLAPLRALYLLQVVISGCLMLGIQCLVFYTAFSFTPTWKIKCIRITFLARCQ